ncbi:hypothetical protein V2S66_31475 [Streptomyces sp. V4-01]|uniref:Helix-turn-helix DNA binding domain protein n=1 Tax=Actinacidiphila polyblastidii TaxID=3110430 RepID=A0ABU7PKW6_9ACTN|nr:hypothetical protein [Streptomyces sp. V4-01]
MTDEQPETPPPPPPAPIVRDGHNRFRRTVEQAKRDAWAADRWGEGWTLVAIGEALGIGKSSVKEAIDRIMYAATSSATEQARNRQRLRLELAHEAAMEVLEATHITVSHGRVITIKDDDGKDVPLRDHAPVLAALDRIVKISESARKLDGIDAATKVQIGGELKYEIVGVPPEDLA